MKFTTFFRIIASITSLILLYFLILLVLSIRQKTASVVPIKTATLQPPQETTRYSLTEAKVSETKSTSKPQIFSPPDYSGESITYHIRYKNLNIGESRFTHHSRINQEGRELNILTFETKLSNFFDKETIYTDPHTMLPVRVEREIVSLLSREKITEDYDQINYLVHIKKRKGKNQQILTLKNTAPINNPILLPYYLRNLPNLNVGQTLTINLPSRSLIMNIARMENIVIPAGSFQAYYIESIPKKIEIWISADKKRIPLKIKDTGALGYTMIMKNYQPPDNPLLPER